MPIEETLHAPVQGAPSTPEVPVPEETAKPSITDVPASEAPVSVVREVSYTSENREITPTVPPETEEVDEVREAARAVALRVREGLRAGAERTTLTVKKGLASARATRDAEERAWDARSARSDLPTISKEAPLLDLATRLHQQAGFFRELAIDALRPTLSRHVLHALVAMLAVFSGLLGMALVWQVMTGRESALFIATSIIAATSALCTAALAGLLERSRRTTSREAFTQALRAEEALEKIAVLLASQDR